jgi:WD40 repeat protein
VGPNLTHGSSVNGAAFSKDETRILSWSEDGAVRLWDTSTGQQIGHDFLLMDEHESWYEVGIKGACLSRDETRILSWDTDRAHLWDSWSGQHIWSASNWVKGAAFLSDESHILTWSGDNSVHLYDAATGGQIGSSLELDGSIDGTVTFKGEVSVLTWKGGVARLWDVKTGQQIGPEFRHEGPGSPVVFSKDEHRILTGCVDTARLWDIETGRQIGADFKLQGPVKGSTFSKDETRILTWSVYGVRLWDTSRNLVARTNVSSLICAAIGGGLGVLSDEDKRDLLLSEAPHDLFAAFAEKLTADQKEILPRVSAGLRAQLHPTCYLPPSVRDPTIASTLLPKESTPQIVAPNKNWAIYLLVLAISIAGALGLIALFWPVGAIDLPELRHLF